MKPGYNQASCLVNNVTLSQTIIPFKRTNNPVLLKCVSCKIVNPKIPENKIEALVLLDDKSTTSYICLDLVSKLKLKTLVGDYSIKCF